MRIDRRDIGGVQRPDHLRLASSTEAPARSVAKSQVELSSQARAVGEAFQQVQGASSLNPERVASLKAQVQGGAYSVDSRVLADRLGQILP
jgi:flagellar biosynthesis anti-sigma factor FlgM